ncbi:hypothetical protein ACVDFE_07890 [Lentzea chajnantorensis]
MTDLTTPEALRRRRAASWRMPALADGRRDPLDMHDEEPMNPSATAATITHLRALGFGAWIPVPNADLRRMWQAGGKCQRLAVEQAELNARWSA